MKGISVAEELVAATLSGTHPTASVMFCHLLTQHLASFAADRRHQLFEEIVSTLEMPHDRPSPWVRLADAPPPIQLAAAVAATTSAYVVAMESTSPDLLEWLSSDLELDGYLSSNNSTPPSVLRQISERGEGAEILNLVFNKNTPIDLLERFAASPHHHLRHQVCANERLPLNVLERLQTDPHPDVRRSARHNLESRRPAPGREI